MSLIAPVWERTLRPVNSEAYRNSSESQNRQRIEPTVLDWQHGASPRLRGTMPMVVVEAVDHMFATALNGGYTHLEHAQRALEACGFFLSQPEGWGFFNNKPSGGSFRWCATTTIA